MNNAPPAAAAPRRLLTWGSAGVVVTLTIIMIVAVCIHRGVIIWESLKWKDSGEIPIASASHGFDLSSATIPVQAIVPSGNTRDFFRPLDRPGAVTVAEALERTKGMRKFIANADRVVGVSCGGESRAYPLRILAYHEIVHDTLGGVPIAVTYAPLGDAVVVFDRRVEDEVLEFGYSGLLYNHNLLFYDRRPGREGESLWCQLQARPVCGPAAASDVSLRILPSKVLPWEQWARLHPETTVIEGKASYLKKKVYDRSLYGRYHFEGQLKPFPLAPRAPEEERPLMTPLVAISAGGQWHEFFYPEVAAAAGPSGTWATQLAGRDVTFYVSEKPRALWYTTDTPVDWKTIHGFWFAWYALRSQAAL